MNQSNESKRILSRSNQIFASFPVFRVSSKKVNCRSTVTGLHDHFDRGYWINLEDGLEDVDQGGGVRPRFKNNRKSFFFRFQQTTRLSIQEIQKPP